MLKKFKVKNFKNFKEEIEFDFGKVGGYQFNTDCITDDLIGKSIIYGKNATGKTNLGDAFGDITYVLFADRVRNNYILNADSDEELVSFYYEFKFDNDILVYEYKKNEDNEIRQETLYLNDQLIFKTDIDKKMITSGKIELIKVENVLVGKYSDRLNSNRDEITDEDFAFVPFLRYIINNTLLESNDILIKFEKYVKEMRMISIYGQLNDRIDSQPFMKYLEKDNNLINFQDFLNIMGVDCRLKLVKQADGKYELYFDHGRLVPFFKTMSSGTQALVNFYKRFIAFSIPPSFIYMDEFDAFCHYDMSEKLVRFFKNNFSDCQIVMTTHNTNLMTNQLMRPDCLMILSVDGRLTALCDATERELREGHNLEKLYIGGEFEDYE